MSEGGSKGSLRSALAHRDLRYLLAGLSVSYVGDWMYGVSLVAYIYQQTHSPTWVAAAGFLRLLPYLLLGTIGGVLADRYERRAVMLECDAARAIIMFVLAATAAASGPVTVAIALVMLSAAAATPYEPALGAMTPALVNEEDLAAANAAMSVINTAGLALGPAIGGLLLLIGSPSVAFALNGVTFLVSLACVAAVKGRSRASEKSSEEPFRDRLAGGFRAVRGSAEIAGLIGVVVMSMFLYGQESVLLILVSRELIGTGSDGVGFLFAAIGVGGMLGAGLGNRLAGDARPGRTLALTLLLSGVALMGVAFTSIPVIAYAFLILDGAGAVILDIVAVTLLQRTVSQDVMARVFGILDTLAIGGTLMGTVVAPVFLQLFGLRVTLLVTGALLPATAILFLPRLRSLNQRSARSVAALAPRVALLEELEIFDGATQPALEDLAARLKEQSAQAGDVIVRESEPADDFFIVRSGALDVLSAGEAGGAQRRINRLEAGDYFGEIGLLERIPRTATVRATTDCDLYRMSGADFLQALSQAPPSGVLRASISGRLARTHPSHRPAQPAVGSASD